MKITKKQLLEMIQGAVANQMHAMHNMGDSEMSPEAHLFYYRGEPSPEMKNTINDIVSALESGGLKMPGGKEAVVAKIIQSIHGIVKNGVT